MISVIIDVMILWWAINSLHNDVREGITFNLEMYDSREGDNNKMNTREHILFLYILQAWASSLRSEYHYCDQYVSIDEIRSLSKVKPENISSPK